jgi:hypothetical protein
MASAKTIAALEELGMEYILNARERPGSVTWTPLSEVNAISVHFLITSSRQSLGAFQMRQQFTSREQFRPGNALIGTQSSSSLSRYRDGQVARHKPETMS